MPSQVIEQLRSQFFASRGISENTPISDADAAALIDAWEQYLYSAGQSGGGIYQPAPPYRPGVPMPTQYIPPPGRPGTPPAYGPYRQGSAGPRTAPVWSGGGGNTVNAPPPRR
jgi:hypothetical protein